MKRFTLEEKAKYSDTIHLLESNDENFADNFNVTYLELLNNTSQNHKDIGEKIGKDGDASDTTVEFTQASSRTNISAGEKLSTLFGKIAKWLADLKTVAFTGNYNDLSNKPDSLPANGGTAETISSTLPVSKGGTGKITGGEAITSLLDSLGAGSAAPKDTDVYLASGVGSDKGNYCRRPLSYLWSYIKSKWDADYKPKLHLSRGNFTGNIDMVFESGTYWCRDGFTGTKPQACDYAMMVVESASGTDACFQRFMPHIGDRQMGTIYERYRINAKWSPWRATDNNTTYSAATSSAAGLMSADDKTKLDGIASGANAYSLPAASATARGGVKTGYTANGKNYPVQLDNEKMYVNVPWTDNNTWRGIQNNLTSDSTDQSLSAAQGKALKALVDGKAASGHTHSYLPLTGGTMDGNLKVKGKITQNASTATGTEAVAFGDRCSATGKWAFAAGSESVSGGMGTVAMGCGCNASLNYGTAFGYATSASFFQMAIGTNNTTLDGPPSAGAKSGTAFMIGNGTSTSDRSNAFRVSGDGKTFAKGAYNTAGADYAEYFEWEDGNVDNEDRRGYFVTLSGNKIKLAEPGDYILGIISAHPSVIGNSDECWNGRYITDDFGSYIEETCEYDEISLDESGEKIITRKTGVTWKQNPDYDPDVEYIQREDRLEWDAVGMVGVLPVRDDGTCEVNGYCTVAEGGIATSCSRSSEPDVYRVTERVGDHVIRVVVK